MVKTPGRRLALARRALGCAALLLASGQAAAATFDASTLSLAWAVPFVAILLAIALGPLLFANFWHNHFGKVSAACALAFLVPFAVLFGPGQALTTVLHTMVAEYVPFIILLTALFTVTGGIHIKGNLHGTPLVNTGILAAGAGMASVMGTTGASMLLIRPLLRANDARRHKVHVVVFFIFLVSNIGGSLTPLGDPPLFLGFLKGVDFFWTTKHMFAPMLVSTVVLLVLFFALDSWYFSRKEEQLEYDPTPDSPLRLEGLVNLLVFGPLIILAVLVSGIWKPGVEFNVFGTPVPSQGLARDVALIVLIGLSLRFTPKAIRQANHFEWGPMKEVAKLFAGIFVTIVPVLAILNAGSKGALAPLVALVTTDAGQPDSVMYFWLTGALSSFLDNAPTYLVFFNLAGGDAQVLMHTLTTTLVAISAGAVFMGANTYIGNAPNFMVKAVAESRGVKMPSFFGYMLWSGGILLPLFVLLTVLFFR
ncbi:MAG: sodium:proton antiporter [Burkholderiales bacterium]|nr:sodium:proton antiporter [Burkholderiales bacterium]